MTWPSAFASWSHSSIYILPQTSLHFSSSTDKGQNSSSGLKTTVNIPSNSLDAWLYPAFPQLHTRAQPAPSAHGLSPAAAKTIFTGQNTQGLEGVRSALKQTARPQGKPMDWAVLCLRVSVWAGQLQGNSFLPPTQNFPVEQWVNIQTSHPPTLTSLTATCLYLCRRYLTSDWPLEGTVQ